MDLDRRTRRDADLRVIDVGRVFRRRVRRRYPKSERRLLHAAFGTSTRRTLAFESEESAWTIAAGDTLIATKGALVRCGLVELDRGQFSQLGAATGDVQCPPDRAQYAAGTGFAKRTWLRGTRHGWRFSRDGRSSTEGVRFIGRDGNRLDLQRGLHTSTTPTRTSRTSSVKPDTCTSGVGSSPTTWSGSVEEIDCRPPLLREGDGRSWWATVDGGGRTMRSASTFRRALTNDRQNPRQRCLERCATGRVGADELTQRPIEGNCIEALREAARGGRRGLGCALAPRLQFRSTCATSALGPWSASPWIQETKTAACFASLRARIGSVCPRTGSTGTLICPLFRWSRNGATSPSIKPAPCMKRHHPWCGPAGDVHGIRTPTARGHVARACSTARTGRFAGTGPQTSVAARSPVARAR